MQVCFRYDAVLGLWMKPMKVLLLEQQSVELARNVLRPLGRDTLLEAACEENARAMEQNKHWISKGCPLPP